MCVSFLLSFLQVITVDQSAGKTTDGREWSTKATCMIFFFFDVSFIMQTSTFGIEYLVVLEYSLKFANKWVVYFGT